MKIKNLLSGTRILEETSSKFNGDIQVVRDFTWGTYIHVNGVTQSGGILNKIWEEMLKKVLETKPHVHNCLILGLGGGSVARVVSRYWVGSSITGVDIDETMVKLGEKYLYLDKIDISIKIEDAAKFVEGNKNKYDLILIDLYCGSKFPEKFESEKFMKSVKNLLASGGIAIFNRLYGADRRADSMKMGAKLEKVFWKVDYVFPQANLELICYN